jgi:hypothetical protein
VIAVSSHRPFKDCTPPILRNQQRAFDSWERAFERVVLFGPKERLGSKFLFVPTDPFPRIVRLVDCCSKIPGWSAIVNADIVIGHQVSQIIRLVHQSGGSCAVSWRWEFTEDTRSSKVVDLGMDFFCAHQSVWKEVGKIYPSEYRIGHSSWDAIMLGAFNVVDQKGLFDLTHHKLVFHPKHEDRIRPHHIFDNTRTECRDRVAWPSRRLR